MLEVMTKYFLEKPVSVRHSTGSGLGLPVTDIPAPVIEPTIITSSHSRTDSVPTPAPRIHKGKEVSEIDSVREN